MEDMKTLRRLKDVLERELQKNVDKGSINSTEIDAVNKAVTALEKIGKIEYMCEEKEMRTKGQDNYSGAFYNIRNFPPMANPMSYGGSSYGNNSYGWDSSGRYYDGRMSGDYSGARGRDMNTGRYVSRDNYSGHSVNDRMIDALERMMDTATSEFEKQQILDKIKMIRNSSDRTE